MQAQACCQVAIEFDHGQLTQTFDQGLRQSRQTGANFNHRLARFGVNGINDVVDDGFVSQEVLTESFPGDVLAQCDYLLWWFAVFNIRIATQVTQPIGISLIQFLFAQCVTGKFALFRQAELAFATFFDQNKMHTKA